VRRETSIDHKPVRASGRTKNLVRVDSFANGASGGKTVTWSPICRRIDCLKRRTRANNSQSGYGRTGGHGVMKGRIGIQLTGSIEVDRILTSGVVGPVFAELKAH